MTDSPSKKTRRLREPNGGARKTVRLEDVAVLAGVSTATVSRSINEPEKVNAEMRKRVLDAAAQLGWIPNAAGRALASNRTHIVGAIIPTLDAEIFARQVSAMQSVFTRHGYTLFLGCSNYDPMAGYQQVRAMLTRGVEALAIVGEDHPAELFDLLKHHRVPYVVTYTYRHDSPHLCIGVDHRKAFRTMTRRLLEMGHRRFAAIFQPTESNRRVVDRIHGMADELGDAGLSLPPERLTIGPADMDRAARDFVELMAGRPDERPTAVVCGNDLLAIGALNGARDLGLVAGRDFSITGFDDLALASRIPPGLTTQWVDNYRIGELAAGKLMNMIGKSDGPFESAELVPELRLRGSSGPAPSP
ncbi:LacI family DNA-binding transcriptional regulator [uncultured Pleomorphomonas sp.]|uniref:LacI family DNA-binding transcriptional regulator n=1 Tax=uncultured Pleomorphomonas sp. TaxID=442121 RepID=UPI00258B2B7E|nr:LacI family DNA-binding transcriptional regulator [uncultured Pleomorphomonas sp.]